MNFQKKTIKRFFLFLLLFVASNCQTFDEVGKVMRNEKTSTTDEFLVEKNQPLVIPPDLNKLPVPSKNNEIVEKNDLEKNKKKQSQSSLEKTILNEIKN